jgi:hypothetical protein
MKKGQPRNNKTVQVMQALHGLQFAWPLHRDWPVNGFGLPN